MNPFFSKQFPITSQPQYYPYPQQKHSLPQQHAVPTSNTIQSMYSSVQPYFNKQFLLSTFRNNADQIQIFLSLPHEDKLKLYLLTEQKKIYGDISDKQGYQKILQQIAVKLHNYQLFHNQGKQQKIDNSQQKKKKDLQSKIDQFCQTGFQKLHLPLINSKNGNQEQKSVDHSHIRQEVFEQQQQQQWIQSTAQSQPKQQQLTSFSSSYQPHSFNSQNNKQNILNSSKNSNVVYNMFNFDSETQKALTKQIGLKTAIEMQRQSIWDLQIDQSQVVSNQPNIKQVFKKKEIIEIKQQKKQQKVQQKVQQSRFNFNYHFSDQANQLNSINSNNYGGLYNFSTQSSSNNYQQSNNTHQYSQQNTINTQQTFTFDFKFNNPVIYTQNQGNNISVSSLISVQTQEVLQSFKFVEYQKPNISGQDNQQFEDEWQQAVPDQPNNYQLHQQQTESNPIQIPTSNFPPQGIMDFNLPQQYEYQHTVPFQQKNYNQNPSKQSENIFDFDFFQTKVQTETPVIQQTANIFLFSSNNYVQSPQSPKLSQTVTSTVQIQSFPTVVQLQSDSYPQNAQNITTQLFLPDNQKRYQIIDNLKIQIKESQKNRIKKSLKTKSFECDPQFYLTIMNYLKDLSLEDGTDYSYFAEQYNIVKEIHELTSNNASIVSQQDEQKIQRALRQTKSLYNKIYTNTAKIQKMADNLINDKNKEKGILYKLGRVLIDSGINSQLISRAGNQPNSKNIFQSFCLLFILQKSNELNKLKTNTEQIINYFTQQYDKFKELDEKTFIQVEENRQKYPQIISYIKGLLKIAYICQRTIGVMKLCCIKSSTNLVKTLKNTKQLLNKFSNYQQPLNQEYFPSEYGEILRQSIKKSISLYELHTRFSEVAQKHPICQLCLINIDNQGEKIEEKGWYHYSCFNLLEVLGNSERF